MQANTYMQQLIQNIPILPPVVIKGCVSKGRKQTRYFFLLLPILIIQITQGFAQLPVCSDSGGILHYDIGSAIYNFNPALPLSATNPVLNKIPYPLNGLGLAVSDNINTPSPAITFYTTINGTYYYYSGNSWIDTRHKASAVNIGAGGGYIYGIVPGSTQEPTYVYRYNGTQNDQLIVTIADASYCLYDIIADCNGNFYVLNTGVGSTRNQWMRKYDSTGFMIQEWHLSNVPVGVGGGGFAIIDNKVFFDNLGAGVLQMYEGTLQQDSINFSIIANLPVVPYPSGTIKDMANCPKALYIGSVKDTLFYCGSTIDFKVRGNPPYVYTVVNGSPDIKANGAHFRASSPDIAVVAIQSQANSCSKDKLKDTFVIIPPVRINAGPDRTLFGCNSYSDTLYGSFSYHSPSVDYILEWAPAGSIISESNTFRPIVAPAANTDYVLTVRTNPGQGGCIVSDTVHITVKDETVSAAYSFSTFYGCDADSVQFFPESVGNVSYNWEFGDGRTDTVSHPKHTFFSQAAYLVKLRVANEICSDEVQQTIDLRHPLTADFKMDKDTICFNGTVTFTNTSITTYPEQTHFLWDFGDNSRDTIANPAHTYTKPGIYKVKMIVKDFVPCLDTAYATITVDTVMPVDFSAQPKIICMGENINFYTATDKSMIRHQWFWGDGGHIDIYPERMVHHAYLDTGKMQVIFTIQFRACPEISCKDTIYVSPLPLVQLGSDTNLCMDAKPITLFNHAQNDRGRYHYLWSTGDTTATISVKKEGTYGLTQRNVQGCATTEEMVVQKDCYLDLPNAFTPNGDGQNDYFFPRQLLSRNLSRFHMQVYNRWGQTVFETRHIEGRGWDGNFNGKEQPQGVYIYRLEVEIQGGKTESYPGNITLIR